MIKKIKNLTKITNASILGYSVLSVISGLTGFAFILLVNSMIELLIINRTLNNKDLYIPLFVVVIIVFFVSRRILSGGIISLSQEIYWNIRKGIISHILKAPPRQIKESKAEIYSALTNDVGNITNGSLLIIEFISSVILILSCFIYMAYISLPMFGVSFIVIFIGIGIYIFSSKKSNIEFNISRDLENDFHKLFTGILKGIKEINLNPIIGEKINKRLVSVIKKAKASNEKALIGYLNTQIIGQVLFYSLITVILFYSFTLFDMPVESSISYIFTLLYILGPIGIVTMTFPAINKTIIALNRLVNLKKKLENTQERMFDCKQHEMMIDFDELEYKNYEFSYGENLFSVGPLNLTINKGEVIFIYGGNGSGKTTLFNVLLNIYEPNEGEIILDSKVVGLEELLSFKGLFSPVFSDFYLFDEMYGVIDFDEANKYLKIFEIDDKVKIVDNKFSTIDLSEGQRKRLALINAILENKSILVLDEWAADQDPIFRKKFYKEIIPYIIKQGFTIIAITHDDKYYDCADRLLKMEFGKLIRVNELV